MNLEMLYERGFDQSEAATEGDGFVVRCSQCEALVINGVPTHERGCPNQVGECEECGGIAPHGHKVCEDCADSSGEICG